MLVAPCPYLEHHRRAIAVVQGSWVWKGSEVTHGLGSR